MNYLYLEILILQNMECIMPYVYYGGIGISIYLVLREAWKSTYVHNHRSYTLILVQRDVNQNMDADDGNIQIVSDQQNNTGTVPIIVSSESLSNSYQHDTVVEVSNVPEVAPENNNSESSENLADNDILNTINNNSEDLESTSSNSEDLPSSSHTIDDKSIDDKSVDDKSVDDKSVDERTLDSSSDASPSNQDLMDMDASINIKLKFLNEEERLVIASKNQSVKDFAM